MLSTVRGSTVIVEVDIKTEGMVYINPDSVKLTILDPNGASVVVNSNMISEEATGFFSYEHDTSTDGVLGPYMAKIEVTQGEFKYILEPFVCFILDVAELPSIPAFQGNAFQNNAFQV